MIIHFDEVMPVFDDLDLIFIHIPKNAGTSIEMTIHGERGQYSGHYDWKKYERDVPDKWKDYESFSVVRNPFDRTVSNYKYARKKRSFWHNAENPEQSRMGKHFDYETLKDRSFSEAVDMLSELEHQGWGYQYPYICDEDENIVVDRILKIENLQEEFNEMLNELGKERKVSLKEKNVTREEKNYREWYGEEEKKKVQEHYKTDIELFDYSF